MTAESLFRGTSVTRGAVQEHVILDVDIDQRTGGTAYVLSHVTEAPARRTARPVLHAVAPSWQGALIGRPIVAAAREIDRLFVAGMSLQLRASGGWARQKWAATLLYRDGSVGLRWGVTQKREEDLRGLVRDLRALWHDSERPDDSKARSLIDHLRDVGGELDEDLRLQRLSGEHADLPGEEFVKLIERQRD